MKHLNMFYDTLTTLIYICETSDVYLDMTEDTLYIRGERIKGQINDLKRYPKVIRLTISIIVYENNRSK